MTTQEFSLLTDQEFTVYAYCVYQLNKRMADIPRTALRSKWEAEQYFKQNNT